MPHGRAACDCPAALTRDPWWSWPCQGMRSHAKGTCHGQLCLQSRRASPEPAEAAAAPGCPGGCKSCKVLTLLLLIYSPAFFFFFPLLFFPFHPLADRFPSDRTSPWPFLPALFPLVSSRHHVGVGWGLSLPREHCTVPGRCAGFLTRAPSEQPPVSS